MATYETRSEWQAAQGGSGGMILRSGFDFTALGVADWTGDATKALTPTSGTVTSAITFTLLNMAKAPVFGPDGSTGIGMQSDGTSQWYGAAIACPGMRATVADLIGSTPREDTMIVIVTDWVGASPAENYKQHGHGIEEGTDALIQCVQYSGAVNHVLRRHNAGGAEDKDVASPTWLMSLVGMDSIASAAGTGAAPTSWPSGTRYGKATIADKSPADSAFRLSMPAASVTCFTANTWGAPLYTPVLKTLNVYELVPS